MTITPTHDDLEELLLSCRYGELEEVQEFVTKFGWGPVEEVRDESGNTVLHMLCGNGHLDLLQYILPHVSSSLISTQNTSGKSTALHWAAMNNQLEVAKALIECKNGPGIEFIDIKNSAGRSPLGEAELAGWDEGSKYFVEVMGIDIAEEVEPEASESSVDKLQKTTENLTIKAEETLEKTK